jgi:probable HAF family extracellular repeat protein
MLPERSAFYTDGIDEARQVRCGTRSELTGGNLRISHPHSPERVMLHHRLPAGVLLAAVASCALALTPARRAGAQQGGPPEFRVDLVGDPAAALAGRITAVQVNDAGHAVGSFWTDENRDHDWADDRHAFLWRDGVLIDLGTLGGAESYAVALNEHDWVVGAAQIDDDADQDGEQDFHAFLWRDGSMTDLGTLGGVNSSATDINENGAVVGSSNAPLVGPAGRSRAFLWHGSVLRDLGAGDGSSAAAINDAGQVAGTYQSSRNQFHAYLWTDSAGMQDLGTLGGQNSSAADINSAGQVVGEAQTERKGSRRSERRAFIWENGTMSQLPGLPEDAGVSAQHVARWRPYSAASSINDAGEIVGSGVADGSLPTPLIWRRRVPATLQELTPSAFRWRRPLAWTPDINNGVRYALSLAAF